jgi:manganese/zinc/iron transport system substrate-binding protein
MDVALWTRCAEQVAATLERMDPKGRTAYRENLRAYRTRLDRLDDYVRDTLARVPPERRVLITAHDAFHYLGRRYGLEVRGVQGISTESEAGIADINRLVELLCTRKIPAVFVESSVSDKNIRALQEGCRARGHAVNLGGTLFSDAMGPAGSYEGTYVGMIDHNVTTIARALGAAVDPQGMQGRLARSR